MRILETIEKIEKFTFNKIHMTTKKYYQEIFKRKWKAFLWMILKPIPDELFIKVKYFLKFKKWIDLDNPKTFNEKLQYLKLKQTDQIYSDLADKYKVREYIKEKLWEEVLTKLYWHGKDPEQIPFEDLPDKFVIKYNHGSWYNILVPNKSKLDIKQTINILRLWMKEDFWIIKRELQYKNIDKMIIIEEFLEDEETKDLYDYKFWCFNWDPEIIQVDLNRANDHRRNLYNIKWNKLNEWIKYPTYNWEIKKPLNLDKMLEYSKKLSKNFPMARIDFYESNWKVYFGEITLIHWSWSEIFFPNHEDLDRKYWEMIKL